MIKRGFCRVAPTGKFAHKIIKNFKLYRLRQKNSGGYYVKFTLNFFKPCLKTYLILMFDCRGGSLCPPEKYGYSLAFGRAQRPDVLIRIFDSKQIR